MVETPRCQALQCPGEAVIPSASRERRDVGRALLALAFGFVSSTAAAQTTDPIFAGWRWAPDVLGSRPAGLGGAFTAIADGGKAAYGNPAGLVLIPAWEVELSTGERWAAVSGSALGHLHLSAYAAKTGAQHVDVAGSPGAFLDSSAWEAGFGLGVEPFRGLKVGGAVAWSHLGMEGLRRVGDADEATTVAADNGQVRLTAGLLLTLVGAETRSFPTLRLGLSYQPGFDWSADVADGNTGEPAVSTAIRRPSLVTAGLAWRANDRWSFSLQGDVIRYREVVDALRRNVGDLAVGFQLPNALEPRFGTEFGTPLWCGCGVVKFRGGLHYRSPGTLAYDGNDPVAAAFTPGRWRTVGTLGFSFLTEHVGHALRLDLDAKDLFEGPDLSFGITWRF
jgi:hypothetical protein